MNNALTKTLTHGLMHGLKYRLSDKGIFNLDSEFGIPPEAYEPMEVVNTWNCGGKIEIELHSCKGNWGVGFIELDEVSPYLFPMSALTKDEFNHIWQNEIDSESLEEWLSLDTESMLSTKFSNYFWENLHKHHFNVFDLSPDEFIEVNETNNPYR